MNNVPEAVLQDCLDDMERGDSIDEIVARYPEVAAGLRPFLETAVQLATLAAQPSLAAKQQSQKAFLAHAESLKVTPVRPSTWYRLRQILMPLASLALLLILFSVAAVSVSASAIPGDALYPVKRLVENVRLYRAGDLETAADLLDQFGQERIREVQTLLRTGRSARVSFEGVVEAIAADEWTVADIEVMVNEATVLVGDPQEDDVVRVNGRTANGTLFASTIELLSASPTPEPTPTPTASATMAPTLTATAEPTKAPPAVPTAEPTSTATNTPIPTATLVPTLAPTATPSPVPTLPPGNDNGNDNDGNDNDGNDNDGNDNDGNDNDGNDNDGNDNDGNDNDNDDDDNDNDGDSDNGGGGDDDDD